MYEGPEIQSLRHSQYVVMILYRAVEWIAGLSIKYANYYQLLSTHPAHVSALHELVMFDLAHAESDGVDVVLEVVGGHVVQVLRVLVSVLDFVPLLRLCTSQVRLSCHVSRVTYVVVVVIILGIVDGHLEPDHLLGPGGHSVVETYLIVTVHVRLLIVARVKN